MKYNRSFVIVFASLSALFILGSSFMIFGEIFPKGEFRSPIKYKLLLSGTYGELRPNHFHAGIDIKSPNGRSGADIVAAADGYISRVKVSASGYGNVIYMNHPNGYTTVYGHLSKFNPAVAKYIKRKQYEKQRFSVNLYPPQDMFKFKKGDVIAKMGNTGTSSGPHLHFEIRDRRTEEPLNAARFGLPLKDNVAPKLHKIKTYLLDNTLFAFEEKEWKVEKKGNEYRLKGRDTLIIGSNEFGLAIKAFDHMEGSRSWNGVYGIKLQMDGFSEYDFKLDRFSFKDTRFVNAHLDYEDKVTKNSTYHRLYTLPGNRLKIYDQKGGILRLNDRKAHQVNIDVMDASGNKSKLVFWVKKGALAPQPAKNFNYLLAYDQPNTIDYGNLVCQFKTRTFYENIYFQVGMTHSSDPTVLSPIYQIHDYTTPVQRYFNISIPAEMLTAEQRAKAFIAFRNKKGNWINAGGKWQFNKMEGKVRSLGEYAILIDTEPPTITPINFSSNMSGATTMSFKLKDNFSTTGKGKSMTYSATVDGKWILMEYRSGKLTYFFDSHVPKGKHTLRISATDGLGNNTVFEEEFTR